MCSVQSVSGTPFLVDDTDMELVSKYHWWVGRDCYPCTKINRKPVRLHQLLLRESLQKGKVVDHINRDRLDNRRSNLRIVDYQRNAINAKISSSNKSGHKGVFFDKQTSRWRAQITVKGKTLSLGRFEDILDAIAARHCAETEYGYDEEPV